RRDARNIAPRRDGSGALQLEALGWRSPGAAHSLAGRASTTARHIVGRPRQVDDQEGRVAHDHAARGGACRREPTTCRAGRYETPRAWRATIVVEGRACTRGGYG